MANLQHGHTFAEHEVRDPAAFNANVDSASLNNVGNADLTTGVRLPTIIQPNSPITGEVYVNDAQNVTFFGSSTAHPFQFFYGGIWNDQEAVTLYWTLTNNSAVDLVAGDVVISDAADVNGFRIPTNLTDLVNVIGVLLDDTVSGATGRVAYYGIALLNLSGHVGGQVAGAIVCLLTGSISGYDQNIATKGTVDIDGLDNTFGVLLSDAVSNQAFAFIWK